MSSDACKQEKIEKLSETTSQVDPNKEDKYQDNDASMFPDGGSRAMLVVLGCFLNVTASMGVTNANGTIENHISTHLLPHEDVSNISWIFAMFNFMSFGSTIILGPLFNQVGARKMLICSIIFFSVGIMCFSESKELYQLILSYAVCGLGCGFSFICSINVITQWFWKNKSLAIGIAFVGSGVGGIIMPIILPILFDRVGFGWAIRILGFICFGLISCALLFVRDRRRELGILGEQQENNPLWAALKQINFLVFKEKVFFTFLIASIGNSVPFFLTLNYLVSYATNNGWSIKQANYLPVALNTLSILGRVFGGYASDRYGRFNFFIVANLIATVACFIFWLPPIIGHGRPGLFTFAVLFGFTSGSYFQSSPACTAQISTAKTFGSRYGTFSCIISVVNLCMLPIGGAIIAASSSSEGYDRLVIFISVIQFCGLLFSILCRYLYGGFNLGIL